jgi:hypothetical protein
MIHRDPTSSPPTSTGWSIYAYLLIAFLAIITILLLLANLFGWRIFGRFYSSQTGGNVAEWVAGVGTVSAIFTGIWAFARESRATAQALRTSAEQLYLAQLDFRSRELQWKATQATHVVAWPDAVDPNLVIAHYPQYTENLHDMEAMFNEAWRRHMADLYALKLRSPSDQRLLSKAEIEDLSTAEREQLEQSYDLLCSLQQRFGEDGPTTSGAILCVLLSNLSDAPIFAVRAEIQTSEQGTPLQLMTAQEKSVSIPVLPPLPQPRPIPLSWSTGHLALIPTRHASLSTLREVSVSLRFTDSAGTSWIRHGDGRLEAMHDDPRHS